MRTRRTATPVDPSLRAPRRAAALGLALAVGAGALVAGCAPAGGPAAAAVCALTVDGERVGLDRAQAREATARAAARATGRPVAEPTAPQDPGASASEGASTPVDDAVVAAILTARADEALTCRDAPADLPVESLTATGLTPRSQAVFDGVDQAFGRVPYGGFAPGGVSTGHMEGSAHYDGRAIDYFFRPVREDNLDAGWVLAQWLVARSDRLEVATVIFDDHVWTSRGSRRGWADYRTAPGASEVTRHRDHVHVDVVAGG